MSTMVMHQDASPTWERHIWVKNPVGSSVWVYLECDGHLTVNPIGLQRRHLSEVVIPGIPPGEQCWVHHWMKQDGRQPPPWTP